MEILTDFYFRSTRRTTKYKGSLFCINFILDLMSIVYSQRQLYLMMKKKMISLTQQKLI